MNKQELIDDIKKITYSDLDYNSPERMLIQQKLMIVDKVRQLDEQSKVTVPQFVAEYLELTKKEEFSFDAVFVHVKKMPERVWLWKRENQETFLRAWLDSYEVEEPLYQVKIPTFKWNEYSSELETEFAYLAWDITSDEYTLSASDKDSKRWRVSLTEETIKNIDERYWAFAIPVEELK